MSRLFSSSFRMTSSRTGAAQGTAAGLESPHLGNGALLVEADGLAAAQGSAGAGLAEHPGH